MIREYRKEDRKELEEMLLIEGVYKEHIGLDENTNVLTDSNGDLLGFYTYEPFIKDCKLLRHFILSRKHRNLHNLVELVNSLKKKIGDNFFATNIYKSNKYLNKLVLRYFDIESKVSETDDRYFYLLKLRRV